MWLSTTTGFFSIVQHRNQPDQYLVRARVRQDLLSLKTLAALAGDVLTTPTADYRYRLYVSRDEMSAILAKLAAAIDYPNFKDRIATLPDQRPKLAAYHRVWSVMQTVEEAPATP